jgi:hypothetical protein
MGWWSSYLYSQTLNKITSRNLRIINIYANNYVDTGDLEDFDDYKGEDKDSKAIKIKYKMFHELPIKTRVDVLYYLC